MATTAKNYLLELSTQVDEASMFTVDGEEYKLLSFDHLSDAEEAEVMGMFQRMQVKSEDFDRAKNEQAAANIATQLKTLRTRILTAMSTMPEEISASLPPSAAGQIIRALRDEIDANSGSDGDDS